MWFFLRWVSAYFSFLEFVPKKITIAKIIISVEKPFWNLMFCVDYSGPKKIILASSLDNYLIFWVQNMRFQGLSDSMMEIIIFPREICYLRCCYLEFYLHCSNTFCNIIWDRQRAKNKQGQDISMEPSNYLEACCHCVPCSHIKIVCVYILGVGK